MNHRTILYVLVLITFSVAGKFEIAMPNFFCSDTLNKQSAPFRTKLISFLSQTTNYSIDDQETLSNRVENRVLNILNYDDVKTIKDLGSEAGVKYVFVGKIDNIGDRFLFSAKLLKVSDLTISAEMSEIVIGDIDLLNDKIPDIISRISSVLPPVSKADLSNQNVELAIKKSENISQKLEENAPNKSTEPKESVTIPANKTPHWIIGTNFDWFSGGNDFQTGYDICISNRINRHHIGGYFAYGYGHNDYTVPNLGSNPPPLALYGGGIYYAYDILKVKDWFGCSLGATLGYMFEQGLISGNNSSYLVEDNTYYLSPDAKLFIGYKHLFFTGGYALLFGTSLKKQISVGIMAVL
ncbi:MAG: hypothetical protein ABSE00_00640 [Chitinispirillaceae bacterium]